jgi:hypothetical protein
VDDTWPNETGVIYRGRIGGIDRGAAASRMKLMFIDIFVFVVVQWMM